jgi:DNA-binding NarL/FixJ family response regulator
MQPGALTDKSRAILEAIAEGHTYEQILAQDAAWTYHDIFRAAAEALDAARAGPDGKRYDERMEEIRQAHPRAYEKWTAEDDDRLRELFRSGTPLKEIARELQRQPSAIRSRLTRLNLATPESSKDGGQY